MVNFEPSFARGVHMHMYLRCFVLQLYQMCGSVRVVIVLRIELRVGFDLTRYGLRRRVAYHAIIAAEFVLPFLYSQPSPIFPLCEKGGGSGDERSV